ncbi:hypothetical protein [Actinoplanes aureus]|uniref:Uncharacterized protein n=1 Tax=Actinoplanes aureus TaxID=2792083 RepID=A0A931C8I9_9ACTN|nr:hypothetical protein [Actinoplanes aureus]MBG0565385.1 hypothetical protein [Actinoplanes aureus]
MAVSHRTLISKAALRRLPATADDGTPYCPQCRRDGELNRMVSTGTTDSTECEVGSLPVYTDADRLSYEELIAGAPCRGCGQELLPQVAPPSWVGKGTGFFTDKERALHAAAEQAFNERHPVCHALRWTMQGSSVTHCARCCPPPPLSPEQRRQIAQILNDGAERRVRQAKLAGTTYERRELEQRLPGRARTLAVVLREYQKRRTAALESVAAEDRSLLRSSFPEAELMFRWRLQLACGDLVEVLTLGDVRPPTVIAWPWAGSRLREGTYACTDHRAQEAPYRRVYRYLTRATMELTGDEHLKRGPETVGYWTVELECGHLDNQVTALDWHPRDGHRQTQPNDATEVAQRKSRVAQIKDCLGALEYAHALRQIEQGYLEPDPQTTCRLCTYEQPIIAFQRVGWLVPAPKPAMTAAVKQRTGVRPARAQLEQRVAELEAQIAHLTGQRRTS